MYLLFQVCNGDAVLLYSLFLGGKTFSSPVRAIRLTRRDCAFHFNTVIESRSNYMSMRNASLISLIFPNLSPLRGRFMCAESWLGADT